MEQYQQQQQVYQANIVSSDKLRQDKKQTGDQRGKAVRNAMALSREPAPIARSLPIAPVTFVHLRRSTRPTASTAATAKTSGPSRSATETYAAPPSLPCPCSFSFPVGRVAAAVHLPSFGCGCPLTRAFDVAAPQFRKFREDLIKGGAPQLKGVQFPRRSAGRGGSSDRTDEKRIPILQGWVNLVIGVYAGQPNLKPLIDQFLDVGQQDANTARLTVSRQRLMEPFEADPKLLEGDWLARGFNSFRSNAIEEERFTIKLEADGVTLTGASTLGAEYTLEGVKLVEQGDGVVILEFHQVYQDGTRTGWFSLVDRAHLNLTNGTWMALSGPHNGEQVGTFTAERILDDPTPGPYRIVSEDGVLVRDGVETISDAVTKLDVGEEIEVVQVIRRADGVMRLCFTKAGLETAAGGLTDATQQLWVSERKTEDQSLLLEKIEEGDAEQFGDAAGGYAITVVQSELVTAGPVTLTISATSVEDLKAKLVAAVPELQGATDLQYQYEGAHHHSHYILWNWNTVICDLHLLIARVYMQQTLTLRSSLRWTSTRSFRRSSRESPGRSWCQAHPRRWWSRSRSRWPPRRWLVPRAR